MQFQRPFHPHPFINSLLSTALLVSVPCISYIVLFNCLPLKMLWVIPIAESQDIFHSLFFLQIIFKIYILVFFTKSELVIKANDVTLKQFRKWKSIFIFLM